MQVQTARVIETTGPTTPLIARRSHAHPCVTLAGLVPTAAFVGTSAGDGRLRREARPPAAGRALDPSTAVLFISAARRRTASSQRILTPNSSSGTDRPWVSDAATLTSHRVVSVPILSVDSLHILSKDSIMRSAKLVESNEMGQRGIRVASTQTR